jgi:hypothetical protein
MNVCQCKLEVAAIRASDFICMPRYKVFSELLLRVTGIFFFFFFFFEPIYIPEYKPETKPGRS